MPLTEEWLRLRALEEIENLTPDKVREINDNLRPDYNLTGAHKASFKARCKELGIEFRT